MAVLDCSNQLAEADSPSLYATTADSIVVLEPDILINTTAVAECFQRTGTLPDHFLVRRYGTSMPREAQLRGTLIGSIFRQLVTQRGIALEKAFSGSARKAALQFAVLDGSSDRRIYNFVRAQFPTLSEFAANIPSSDATPEVTYFSNHYGLSGRLDAIVGRHDESRTQLLELKSSKPPDGPTKLKTKDGEYDLRALPNHATQAIHYHMLASSADPKFAGNSNQQAGPTSWSTSCEA